MNLSFLPESLLSAIKKLDINKLTEIRFRLGQPVLITYDGKKSYLSSSGSEEQKEKAFVCNEFIINFAINNLTEKSLYAHNEKLKLGFLTFNDGIRVGVCGECVVENKKILTIKNVTSLNVRIPHEISGCAKNIFDAVRLNEKLSNVLIISPPAYGKTTILKDLVRLLNKLSIGSILIVDERGEFFGINGENVDVIKYSDKDFAFSSGIRAMSPKVIVTDELYGANDWKSVKKASECGVKVIASCHAESIDNVKEKEEFISGVFDYYVLLNGEGRPGVLKSIFNKNFKVIV